MTRALVAGVLAALFLVTPTAGWNDKGHMTVAAYAYDLLTDPIRLRVAELLKLNPSSARWNGLVASQPASARPKLRFMHAAIWADDIKGTVPGYTNDTDMSHPRARQNTGYSDRFQHRYWHYVDYPFSQDGTPLNQAQIPAINAEERMALFAKTLGSSASESVKSYDLVWLLHLVGDVHQPLHATARVSKALRRGDQGGNLHSVCYDKKLQNCQTLHSFWDGIVGDTHVAAEAAQFANMLNVPDPAEAANLDVSDWTSQSFELAKQQVYVAPIVVNGSKSLMNGEYRMNARNLSRDRMSLGGARLAALINANLK